jgi:hypothetical protein
MSGVSPGDETAHQKERLKRFSARVTASFS